VGSFLSVVIAVLIFMVLAISTRQNLHVDRGWVAFLGVLLGIFIHKFILPI